jgi:hypothetical protein
MNSSWADGRRGRSGYPMPPDSSLGDTLREARNLRLSTVPLPYGVLLIALHR